MHKQTQAAYRAYNVTDHAEAPFAPRQTLYNLNKFARLNSTMRQLGQTQDAREHKYNKQGSNYHCCWTRATRIKKCL